MQWNHQQTRKVSGFLNAMPEPTLNYVPCPDASGGHRMAYWE